MYASKPFFRKSSRTSAELTAAAEDPNSPIFGMPILDVHKAKTVVVVKRSLSAGFAGIPNGLFIRDNSLMVKGDAKEVLQATTSAIKEL